MCLLSGWFFNVSGTNCCHIIVGHTTYVVKKCVKTNSHTVHSIGYVFGHKPYAVKHVQSISTASK